MTADNALGAEVDPECLRGMHETADLLAALGHEIEEASPALPGKDTLRLFTGAFGPAVALQVTYGELLAGRPPEEDEIEPLSRALVGPRPRLTSVEYLACLAQLQALARGVVAFFAEYDVAAHPRAGRAPAADRRVRRPGRGPDGGLRPLRRTSRRSRRSSTSRASPRSRSRPASARTACRPTPSSSAKPLGEDTLLQLAAQLEAARPAAGRRPSPRRD